MLPYSFSCSPTPPMESNTNCRNDHNAPPLPTGLSNFNLKLEILDDDFCIDNFSSSKGYLQDFQNLDHFPLTASSFNLDIGIQANGFDPFDPFSHGSYTEFGLYEFKPFEENGSMSATMQDFQGGGFLNFPERKDSLMEIESALKYHDPKPLCFVVRDESSFVTADNLGCHKEDGSKRSKNSIQSNNSNVSESVLTKKCARGRKKFKSAKGQWTAEEDR